MPVGRSQSVPASLTPACMHEHREIGVMTSIARDSTTHRGSLAICTVYLRNSPVRTRPPHRDSTHGPTTEPPHLFPGPFFDGAPSACGPQLPTYDTLRKKTRESRWRIFALMSLQTLCDSPVIVLDSGAATSGAAFLRQAEVRVGTCDLSDMRGPGLATSLTAPLEPTRQDHGCATAQKKRPGPAQTDEAMALRCQMQPFKLLPAATRQPRQDRA